MAGNIEGTGRCGLRPRRTGSAGVERRPTGRRDPSLRDGRWLRARVAVLRTAR
ncbi:MAG TPA: hypothetical protein VM033_04920 [Gemmatimonadaceae bacterium]|nr:hypothetical protein [Gemmatimonadaceae bacterium]